MDFVFACKVFTLHDKCQEMTGIHPDLKLPPTLSLYPPPPFFSLTYSIHNEKQLC